MLKREVSLHLTPEVIAGFEGDPARYRPLLAPPVGSRRKRKERNLWQRRFWEHMVRDQADFDFHCDYIHYNPVKHGWAAAPGAWPYSSFHRFVRQGHYPSDWGANEAPEIPDWVGHE